MLILTDTFLNKELKPLKKYYTISDLKHTVIKTDISGTRLPHLGYKYGYLVKLRMKHKVAGRMIVYVFVQKKWFVPIVLRLKKDKVLGENISTKNKKAKNFILKRLDETMEDIRRERIIKLGLTRFK